MRTSSATTSCLALASESGPACFAVARSFSISATYCARRTSASRVERAISASVESDLFAFLQRERGFDLGIAFCFGLADLSVAFDFRRAPLAERVQIAFFVANLLNRQSVKANAHLLQVNRGFTRQLLREALAVVVNLFDRQRAEDGAQVAFQSLKDQALKLVVRHAQESLRGGA